MLNFNSKPNIPTSKLIFVRYRNRECQSWLARIRQVKILRKPFELSCWKMIGCEMWTWSGPMTSYKLKKTYNWGTVAPRCNLHSVQLYSHPHRHKLAQLVCKVSYHRQDYDHRTEVGNMRTDRSLCKCYLALKSSQPFHLLKKNVDRW